jgi:outer membrane protein
VKKISLILNIVLVLAVAALFVLHFTGSGKGKTDDTVNPAVMSEIPSDARIAFVQIDTLLSNMQMYKDLNTKLTTRQQQLEASFGSKYKAFEKEALDLQTKAQKGLLTRLEIQETEQQLSNKGRELETQRNEYLMQLQEENSVAQNQVIDYIMEYLAEYNAENKFDFVFSYSFGGGLLYANRGLDITAEVMSGINAKYQKEQAAGTKK